MKLVLFLTLFLSFIASTASFAQRGPAVDPVTEISAEDRTPAADAKGFNFSNKSETKFQVVKSKDGKAIPVILFLMSLPIFIWIGVMRNLANKTRKESKSDLSNVSNIADYKSDDDDIKKAS